MLQLIYPRTEQVSEERARGWLADAVANEEVFLMEGETPENVPLEVLINLLMDTGKFSFATKPVPHEPAL